MTRGDGVEWRQHIGGAANDSHVGTEEFFYKRRKLMIFMKPAKFSALSIAMKKNVIENFPFDCCMKGSVTQ